MIARALDTIAARDWHRPAGDRALHLSGDLLQGPRELRQPAQAFIVHARQCAGKTNSTISPFSGHIGNAR